MSKGELIFGLIYILIHTIALPILLELHAIWNPGQFTVVQYNVGYLIFSFAVVLIAFRKYLRIEFDTFLDYKLLNIFTAIQCYFIVTLLNYLLVIILIFASGGDLEAWINPNNGTIISMAEHDLFKVVSISVLLGPIVEETLFRGAIFGWLRTKSRFAAYVVSILLFSLLHVWQYAVAEQSMTVLIYALDYIPAGFVLAWGYERTGSLWTPILFHMLTNAMNLAMLA